MPDSADRGRALEEIVESLGASTEARALVQLVPSERRAGPEFGLLLLTPDALLIAHAPRRSLVSRIISSEQPGHTLITLPIGHDQPDHVTAIRFPPKRGFVSRLLAGPLYRVVIERVNGAQVALLTAAEGLDILERAASRIDPER